MYKYSAYYHVVMSADNVQHECYPGEWPCPSSGICILMEQLCDGTPHCPDGEDETNSTAGHNCSQYLFIINRKTVSYHYPQF